MKPKAIPTPHSIRILFQKIILLLICIPLALACAPAPEITRSTTPAPPPKTTYKKPKPTPTPRPKTTRPTPPPRPTGRPQLPINIEKPKLPTPPLPKLPTPPKPPAPPITRPTPKLPTLPKPTPRPALKIAIPPIAPPKTIAARPQTSPPVPKPTIARPPIDRSLRLLLENRGQIEPGTVLLTHPGNKLQFQVAIATNTPLKTKSPLRKTNESDLGTASALVSKPGQTLLESNRRMLLEVTGGTLQSLDSDTFAWTAPKEPGLQKITFDLEEGSLNLQADPQGKARLTANTRHRAQAEVSIMVQYAYSAEAMGALEGFPVGLYPNEKGPEASSYVQTHVTQYAPPKWFIRVTPETAAMRVSPHFTIGDFSPPSMRGKPHFIALRTNLIDFLEALDTAVKTKFGATAKIAILRSYMSPMERMMLAQKGVTYTNFTRFQYGDAAAIIIDANADNLLDDLNKDGKTDLADAEILEDLITELQSKRSQKGWMSSFSSPIETNWPKTPYVLFDLRDTKSE